MFYKIWFIFSN